MSEERAIIDIGSNTVRLVIYGGPPRAPAVLLNEKVTPKLGRDVSRSGQLSEKCMQVALGGLARYAALLRLKDVQDVEVVATAAVRDAGNGEAFLDRVRALGLPARLLSGQEEARISALGVTAAFPGASGIAGDLGGGSLEVIRIGAGKHAAGITLPFGSLRLPDLRAGEATRFSRTITKGLRDAGWRAGKNEPFFIVGGSWRALAVYAMHELQWPLEDPHGFEIDPETALRICRTLAQGKIDQSVPRISSSRLAVLPDAAALLGVLVQELEPSRVVFSSWGLREGLLYDALDDDVRSKDPMLEGVKNFAASMGVSGETAARVSNWTARICSACDPADENLRLAATLLSLAAMQSEPNMRADQAMGWALRKRWIGLDPRGRALIAMAVLANSGILEPPPEFGTLAGEADLSRAICWGLSVRLCRRLTGCTAQALAQSSISRTDDELVLSISAELRSLYHNGTAKDMRILGEWLGLKWSLGEGEPLEE